MPKDFDSKPDPHDETEPTGWWAGQQENVITLVLALVIAIGIRTFIAEPRWIPSESMLPTLEVGDRLVVEKVSYRFRDPARGDIMVFYPPPQSGFSEAYIKRVVGLPGDTIAVRLGEGVYINGVLLDESYVAEPPALSGYPFGDLEVLGDITLYPSSETEADQPIVVPEDQYFVMGDNRNNSQDSHVWGFLPAENIIGRTVFRFWPLNRLRVFGTETYPTFTAFPVIPVPAKVP